MKFDRQSQFAKRISRKPTNGHSSSFSAIVLNLIAIAVFIGAYYYIVTHNLFEDKQVMIYWGMKVLVAYNIIAASTRSLFIPFLAVGLGLANLFTSHTYAITLISSADTMQLIGIGIAGFIINLMINR